MQKETLIVFIALFSLAIASNVDLFHSWMQEHSKSYKSLEEESYRFSIWKAKYEHIEQFNSEGHYYKKGINAYSDMTHKEFVQYFNLRTINKNHVPRNKSPQKPVDMTGLPASVDWRTKGAVTPIKNQGECGSSPYFSAVVSIEGVHVISGQGSLIALSEQQIIDCSGSYGNDGCDGGWMNASLAYVRDAGGIDTEAFYNYTSGNGEFNSTCLYSPKHKGASITSYVNIAPTEQALTAAIAIAPVASAVFAETSNFQDYASGVFSDPECSQSEADHGIAVVGYGTTTINGTSQDYYILKNSWGTSWGEKGYMLLARNDNNMCDIATVGAAYAVISS